MADNKENIHSCTLIKKGGVLIFKNKSGKQAFDVYAATVGEGQDVELLYSSLENRAPMVKLAKANIWIKKLAEEIGESPESIKKQAKVRAGYCIDGNCKSLGDMSGPQLDAIMREVHSMAEFVGFTLH